MSNNRRDSLNPEFLQRLNRIQTTAVCRFCLSTDHLENILESERIQLLLTECYHGCLATLKGNASKFVCNVCVVRLEQSYEFLRLASRVQTLVDTYTYHDGEWPSEAVLRKKRPVPSSDSDDSDELSSSELVCAKKVRFEDNTEEELDWGTSPSATPVSGRCATPANFRKFGEFSGTPVRDISASSLDTTLSGEIPGLESCITGASSSSSTCFEADFKGGELSKKVELAAEEESLCGCRVVGKDLSIVQKLCLRVRAIEVGRNESRSEEELKLSSAEETQRSESVKSVDESN